MLVSWCTFAVGRPGSTLLGAQGSQGALWNHPKFGRHVGHFRIPKVAKMTSKFWVAFGGVCICFREPEEPREHFGTAVLIPIFCIKCIICWKQNSGDASPCRVAAVFHSIYLERGEGHGGHLRSTFVTSLAPRKWPKVGPYVFHKVFAYFVAWKPKTCELLQAFANVACMVLPTFLEICRCMMRFGS
jgi:hypothetical protein